VRCPIQHRAKKRWLLGLCRPTSPAHVHPRRGEAEPPVVEANAPAVAASGE
jgi:hypothetical protein